VRINGADLHVEDTGGPGPAVVFSHGLLWSTKMWRFQVTAFRDRYRCIAYDHRGQGRSEVTASGYDMDTLAEDAAALIERLGAAPVHFVGLSMGGFVGMRVGARRPDLIRSLVLMETASDTEPWRNVPKYAAMSFLTRFLGTAPFVPAVMKIMFGRSFRGDPAKAELRDGLARELLGNDVTGMRRALKGVTSRKPVGPEELARITAPTLVISGSEDSAVVPRRSMRTAARIRGARFLGISRAGHTSSIEEPEAVNHALSQFWDSLSRAVSQDAAAAPQAT
jgi:pimeloyl-ACP methyl ester carboxylesterase